MYSLLFVALALLFLMAVGMSGTILCLFQKMLRSQQNLLSNLSQQNRELTSLCAAKDLDTFRSLVAIQNPTTTSAFSEGNSVPMDDQSVAMRMAEMYRQNGQDPANALDDPMEDFGGIGVLL